MQLNLYKVNIPNSLIPSLVNKKNEPKNLFRTFFSSFQVLGFFLGDFYVPTNSWFLGLSVHRATAKANKSDAFKEGKFLSISLFF